MTFFRRLSLIAFLISASSLFALEGTQEASSAAALSFPQETFVEPDSAISIETKDIDLFLEGRVKEEFFYFDRVGTLRDDTHDSYHFFRNKIKLNAYAEYGRRTYGRTASQAELRLAGFHYWDEAMKYTRQSEEGVYLNEANPHQKILLGEHKHESAVPLVYLSKAWINFDLDVLYPKMTPTSVKAGYFRYKVGRGIALGSYFEGSVGHLGWQDHTYSSNATQSPPGILLEIEFNEKCALELYYSLMRARATSPHQTRAPLNAHRLDMDYERGSPRDLERGTKNDTEIFSAKMEFDTATKNGSIWHFEPYTIGVNAPEQTIELDGDAGSRFGTTGMMVECHKGQFSLNAEAAFQYGYQQVHAIDRNRHEFKINDADGQAVIRHSHLEKGATPFTNPYASKAINEAVNLSLNRGVERIGEQLRDAAGAPLEQDAVAVKNMNYPFGGLNRFRKGYKVTYGGYMGMIDVAYRSKNRRVTVGATAGVVSGDTYPYNTQEDKKYTGFLPMRDQNYFGKYVRSFAMFYGRKIPRPNDMADHKMYAYNHDESTANLRWFGVGGQIHPLKNPQELTIMPVWFSFWEDMPPAKWDNDAARSFGHAGYDGLYKALQGKYGFSGAADPEVLASRHLGHELSLCTIWKPMPNCEMSCAVSAFLPGQLYRDVKGMPNYRTRFLKPNAEVQLQSLGTGVVLGISGKMAFRW